MTSAKICAVVKADVYGLGVEALSALEEADEFAVSCPTEAQCVRAHTDKPINILSLPDFSAGGTYGPDTVPAVAAPEDVSFVRSRGATAVNVKFNSGMNRYGTSSDGLEAVLRAADALHMRVKGVFSHLYDLSAAERQFALFYESVLPLKDYFPQKHILASNFVRLPAYMHLDMVRPGIVLYGFGHESVRSAITATCGVAQVRTVSPTDNIGYGVCPSGVRRTVAVLSAGYGDGVRRLANGAPRYVTIGRALCPVVGQICMDAMMADVTGLSVQKGDTAEIVSDAYGCEAVATACDTIPYEVLTGFSQRVRREYV